MLIYLSHAWYLLWVSWCPRCLLAAQRAWDSALVLACRAVGSPWNPVRVWGEGGRKGGEEWVGDEWGGEGEVVRVNLLYIPSNLHHHIHPHPPTLTHPFTPTPSHSSTPTPLIPTPHTNTLHSFPHLTSTGLFGWPPTGVSTVPQWPCGCELSGTLQHCVLVPQGEGGGGGSHFSFQEELETWLETCGLWGCEWEGCMCEGVSGEGGMCEGVSGNGCMCEVEWGGVHVWVERECMCKGVNGEGVRVRMWQQKFCMLNTLTPSLHSLTLTHPPLPSHLQGLIALIGRGFPSYCFLLCTLPYCFLPLLTHFSHHGCLKLPLLLCTLDLCEGKEEGEKRDEEEGEREGGERRCQREEEGREIGRKERSEYTSIICTVCTWLRCVTLCYIYITVFYIVSRCVTRTVCIVLLVLHHTLFVGMIHAV